MRKPKQIEMRGVSGWGGKRKGAGRKNRTGKLAHLKREKISGKEPLHITWRLVDGLPSLRDEDLLESFKHAAALAQKHGLRMLHFSLQSNHLHLDVEANNLKSLSRGMSCLAASFGRAIRRAAGKSGPVFAGRYHLHVLKTPTEVRNGLGYVLLNQSKHARLLAHDDRFSSAPYFRDWKKLLGRNVGPILEQRTEQVALPSFLSEPRTWLAKEGWKKASGSFRSD